MVRHQLSISMMLERNRCAVFCTMPRITIKYNFSSMLSAIAGPRSTTLGLPGRGLTGQWHALLYCLSACRLGVLHTNQVRVHGNKAASRRLEGRLVTKHGVQVSQDPAKTSLPTPSDDSRQQTEVPTKCQCLLSLRKHTGSNRPMPELS